MIKESEEYKFQFCWFTTLIGKKVNFDKIKLILKRNLSIADLKTTTFCQGKLARWGIAWTFLDNEKLNNFKISQSIDTHIKIPEKESKLISKMRFTRKKRKRNNSTSNLNKFNIKEI